MYGIGLNENKRNSKLRGNGDRTRQNQSLLPSLQDTGTSNMSLQKGRANNRPFALSMHFTSYIKRTSKEYGFKDWQLASKQTRVNNKTFECISHIHKLNRL